MYKDNASWIAVAKYMYGDQWKEILLPAPQQDEEIAEEGATAGGNTRTQETIAIELYLHQYDDYAHDDISQIATLQFPQRYTSGFSPQVGGAIPSEDDSDSDDGNVDNTELSRWQPGQNPIIVGSETEAKDIVTNQLRTANAKKGVINILTSHVPLRYGKKTDHKRHPFVATKAKFSSHILVLQKCRSEGTHEGKRTLLPTWNWTSCCITND